MNLPSRPIYKIFFILICVCSTIVFGDNNKDNSRVQARAQFRVRVDIPYTAKNTLNENAKDVEVVDVWEDKSRNIKFVRIKAK